MLMIRRFRAPARLAAALAFLLPSLGYAHVAELEAVLDVAQETPAPVGTNPGAGGTGDFVLEDDGTVQATVPYQGPTGTITGTGSVALSAAQQQTLFAGGMYFNIHTARSSSGEIRGQIHLKAGSCACDGADSPAAFKSCVRNAIKQVEKAERREES